eukprot:scaffold49246_cov60-Phaeocystis_antarctica.AAC.1
MGLASRSVSRERADGSGASSDSSQAARIVWSITYAERCESLGEKHVVIVRQRPALLPWGVKTAFQLRNISATVPNHRDTTTTTLRFEVTSQWRPRRRTGERARSRRCRRAVRSDAASGLTARHTPHMRGSRPAQREWRRTSSCSTSAHSPGCLPRAARVSRQAWLGVRVRVRVRVMGSGFGFGLGVAAGLEATAEQAPQRLHRAQQGAPCGAAVRAEVLDVVECATRLE